MKLSNTLLALCCLTSSSLYLVACSEETLDQNLLHENKIITPRNNNGLVEVLVTSTGKGKNKSEAEGRALKSALAKVLGVSLDIKERKQLDINASETDSLFSLSATVNSIEEINTKLNGKAQIKSYETKQEIKNKDGETEVIVHAVITYYEASAETKRKRIAIMPLRLSGSSVCETQFSEHFAERVNDYLVQTNNFAIIDRAYLSEKNAEFRMLENDSNMNSNERAKLGNSLATDYMFVGSIDDFSFKSEVSQEAYTNEVRTKNKGNIRVSWRLINVPTGMVVDSGMLTHNVTNQDFKSSSDSCLIDKFDGIAKETGSRIVDAIYPIPVVGCNGNVLTLGRGGEYIMLGQTYNVFKFGDDIVNPYTGESIGKDEIPIGKATISDLSPKISHAMMLDSNLSINDCKKYSYVVRINKEDEVKENKKTEIRVPEPPKKPKF